MSRTLNLEAIDNAVGPIDESHSGYVTDAATASMFPADVAAAPAAAWGHRLDDRYADN